jgi:hypothetical protein
VLHRLLSVACCMANTLKSRHPDPDVLRLDGIELVTALKIVLDLVGRPLRSPKVHDTLHYFADLVAFGPLMGVSTGKQLWFALMFITAHLFH